MAKQVYAYLNHGRWLVSCPVHFGTANRGSVAVKPGDVYIPSCCYPGILAFIRDKGGIPIPDRSARRTARLQAEQNGDVYEIVFPDEREEVEEYLKHRRPENKNWFPGETIEIMTAQELEAQRRAKPLPLADRVRMGDAAAIAELKRRQQGKEE